MNKRTFAILSFVLMQCLFSLTGCIFSACKQTPFKDMIVYTDGGFGYYKEHKDDDEVYLVALPEGSEEENTTNEIVIPEKLDGYRVKALGYFLEAYMANGFQLYGGDNTETIVINYSVDVYLFAISKMQKLNVLSINCTNVRLFVGSTVDTLDDFINPEERTNSPYTTWGFKFNVVINEKTDVK
ncbi:MAG: hypothetical protein LBP26_00510 [Clostridiales bacterium]|jgi:hypothetical protein|nr:hypothetical protein [Clostridiales bacterium]